MKKVILFDLDGTLIDSTEAIIHTFYYTFEKFKIDFNGDDKDIKSLIGYPLEVMYEKLGCDKNIIDELVLSYKEHYRLISKDTTILIDGAIESLEIAKNISTIGVVTTKTTRYSMPLLEHLGISKYFKTIIGREEVINPKPHAEPILKALQNLNVTNRNNVFMIGDTKLDIISANSANVHGIGVLSGYGTKEELQNYTSYIYKNSLEAIKFIAQFN